MSNPLAELAATRRTESEHAPRPHLWVLIFVILALIAVAVSVLGPEPAPAPIVERSLTPTPSRESRIYTVRYRSGVFSPTNLRIHAGDTVRFLNDGGDALRIIADLRAGSRVPEFDSVGLVEAGSYFSYTFPSVGEYSYRNYDNGSEAGVILVR
jgi:plastocyanin